MAVRREPVGHTLVEDSRSGRERVVRIVEEVPCHKLAEGRLLEADRALAVHREPVGHTLVEDRELVVRSLEEDSRSSSSSSTKQKLGARCKGSGDLTTNRQERLQSPLALKHDIHRLVSLFLFRLSLLGGGVLLVSN